MLIKIAKGSELIVLIAAIIFGVNFANWSSMIKTPSEPVEIPIFPQTHEACKHYPIIGLLLF